MASGARGETPVYIPWLYLCLEILMLKALISGCDTLKAECGMYEYYSRHVQLVYPKSDPTGEWGMGNGEWGIFRLAHHMARAKRLHTALFRKLSSPLLDSIEIGIDRLSEFRTVVRICFVEESHHFVTNFLISNRTEVSSQIGNQMRFLRGI